MTFQVEINGRSRTLSVERTGRGRYRVTIDGRPREIDAARVGGFGLSLLLDGERGVSREVQVAPVGTAGELLVRLDGRTVTATMNGRRTGRAAADASAQSPGDQPVVAPMPGRIVRVLVARGDTVAARQAVVVVEAMKMENELRAPKDGRVKEVAVEPGASVEAGRVLVVIE
jgi:acetyl/propionyl-CoA carboxylase alpha subunit